MLWGRVFGDPEELVSKAVENGSRYAHMQCIGRIDNGQSYMGIINRNYVGLLFEYQPRVVLSANLDGSRGKAYLGKKKSVTSDTLETVRNEFDEIKDRIKRSVKDMKVYIHI